MRGQGAEEGHDISCPCKERMGRDQCSVPDVGAEAPTHRAGGMTGGTGRIVGQSTIDTYRGGNDDGPVGPAWPDIPLNTGTIEVEVEVGERSPSAPRGNPHPHEDVCEAFQSRHRRV